jgi:hypothetical protein
VADGEAEGHAIAGNIVRKHRSAAADVHAAPAPELGKGRLDQAAHAQQRATWRAALQTFLGNSR